MSKEAPSDSSSGEGYFFYYLGVALLAVTLIIVFITSNSNGSDERISTSDKQRAVQICKTSIKNSLKAPSTAKFSNEAFQYNPSDENDYQIAFTVDAQNSFGAMMQEDYACQVTWLPYSEKWSLERVFQRY